MYDANDDFLSSDFGRHEPLNTRTVIFFGLQQFKESSMSTPGLLVHKYSGLRTYPVLPPTRNRPSFSSMNLFRVKFKETN